MRNLYYRMSIKLKMVIAFSGVSLLSVLLMAFISYYYYGIAVQRDFYKISTEATTRLNHHMEYYFRQMQKSTTTLIQSRAVQQWLQEEDAGEGLQALELESELKRYVALNYPEIISVFLVSEKGALVSTREYAFRNSEKYMEEPWYGLPLYPDFRVLPTHIPSYPEANGRPAISLLIPIYSQDTIAVIGRLVIDISLTQIHETFSRTGLGDSGIFYMISQDDIIVYHPKWEWQGQPKQSTSLMPLALDQQGTTYVAEWQGEKQLISVTQSPNTKWRIVAQVPFEDMAGGLSSARDATFIALVIILFGIAIAVPVLSNKFNEPIRRLKQLMERVSKGDLAARAEAIPGQDDFQHLNRSFNIMVARLDELMNTVTELRLKEAHARLRQKDAIIEALQNQINPHLLYNSLDIIKSMAYLENTEAVVKMAKNLGDVYRYTAKITEKEVTLREELDHVRKYLGIVHIRFPKDFQSNVYVHEKYAQHKVVKLSLQPIIENAVKYAVEPLGGKGAILVNAYHEKNDLIIEIADNGPGIGPEELERLQARLEAISRQAHESYAQHESLGVSNVHARLVLQYGERYGVSLHSFPGRGTVVSIRIPFRIGSQEAVTSSIEEMNEQTE